MKLDANSIFPDLDFLRWS